MITLACKCGCGEYRSVRFQSEVRKGFLRGHYRKFQVGDKAPGWKGGMFKKRGYIHIYSPNHPHNDCRYVKRSRLTMEKKLGRYLLSSEIVHHINGKRDDDRIENLALTTRAEHTGSHWRGKKLDRVNHRLI